MLFIFGEPRIKLKPLALLCRRLAMSLSAGLDVRTVWAREANSARGAARRRYAEISEAVAEGTSISESVKATGNFFPEFFRDLTKVGEESGHLPEVFRQLADHYDHQLSLRRSLLRSLAWPMFELTLSLSVVGVAIWLMGAIPQLARNQTDLFGFGLTGTSGLMTYLAILGAVGFAGFLCYRAMARGVLWVAPLQRAIMRVPRLGRALETLAMARLAWVLHVTLNSGMELRAALRMSLASTHNALYTQHIDRVLLSIRNGQEIHEALAAAGDFPSFFVDAVAVGEQSGQLVESMGHLAQQYQEESRMAMGALTAILGLVVTAVIAGVIIFLIFRVFSFYLNTLNGVINGR